jgi:hypothetical protein
MLSDAGADHSPQTLTVWARVKAAIAAFNEDGVVDGNDYAAFAGCFGGPSQPIVTPGGEVADFDGGGDVDVADFAPFSICFDGPTQPENTYLPARAIGRCSGANPSQLRRAQSMPYIWHPGEKALQIGVPTLESSSGGCYSTGPVSGVTGECVTSEAYIPSALEFGRKALDGAYVVVLHQLGGAYHDGSVTISDPPKTGEQGRLRFVGTREGKAWQIDLADIEILRHSATGFEFAIKGEVNRREIGQA